MLNWKGRTLSSICSCCAESLTATGVSRRQFVAGAAAAGFAATSFAPKVFAQAKPHRIDVHAHIVPPAWFAAMQVIGRDDFPLTNWSVQKMIEDMDKGGVATSMTSPTTPQVTPLGKEVAVRVARESNEYAKKLMADHPSRFGVWATLAVAAHRREPEGDRLRLRHAQGRRRRLHDELRRQVAWPSDVRAGLGGIEPPQGDGLYASDIAPIAAPIWCRACRTIVVEFGTDTTRTIASLILSGTSQKYKRHQLDLVARRRRADGVCRTLPDGSSSTRRRTGARSPSIR